MLTGNRGKVKIGRFQIESLPNSFTLILRYIRDWKPVILGGIFVVIRGLVKGANAIALRPIIPAYRPALRAVPKFSSHTAPSLLNGWDTKNLTSIDYRHRRSLYR